MEQLIEDLKKWNIVLSDKQIIQFSRYNDLLMEWNSFMNLTAITEPGEVMKKHFLDSLALGRFHSLSEQSLLDLGTGSGFPGVPLKILCPSLRVVLADSLKKRLRFLDLVISKLELEHISTIHGRAEDLGHDANLRERFDLCTSRAVANLTTLSEYCLPLVRKGGWFVSYKSEKANAEMAAAEYAIKQLGGSFRRMEKYVLPNSDLGRTLVFVEKTEITPPPYPRKAGTPTREPLVPKESR